MTAHRRRHEDRRSARVPRRTMRRLRPMHAIAEWPLHTLLGTLLWLLSAVALWHGMRHLAIGLREIDHPTSALRVVRALRGVIVAVSFAALGGGMLFTSTGLVV